MDDLEWFGFEGQLSDEERAFLALLCERTEEWARPWCRREDLREDGALIVGLDVDAPEVALLTVGMHLAGNRIRGDRLDHAVAVRAGSTRKVWGNPAASSPSAAVPDSSCSQRLVQRSSRALT